MYNKSVKIWTKIPNRLGGNVRKPQGDFLTHTVECTMVEWKRF